MVKVACRAFCCCLLAAVTPLAAAEVAVPNGGFEQGLEGWNLIRPGGFAHGEVTTDGGEAHGGQRAARVVNPTGDKVMVGLVNAGFVPLPAESRTFRVSFWMKAITAPAMVELRIASTNASGQALVPFDQHGWRFVRPAIAPMVGQWYQVKAGFGAQDDWGGVQLTIWVNGPGAEVLVDEVTITTVDPEELAVPQVGARLPAAGAAAWWEGPLRKVYPNEQPPPATAPGLEL
ncbi:MAG: hypothetical protein HUU35_10820, partial [Armatimonadetes bacterium]|nr:hypothetical protein [Armatimonadota bacterium]